MRRSGRLLVVAIAVSLCASFFASAAADDDRSKTDADKKIKLIHIGDIHGHLIPRPNVRSDGDGRKEGGLARMYTKIQKIRNKNTLLINTGDTVQGSAEALYTRGQALVDVVNMFHIDAFAPGNWEFVYGTERFRELFAGVNGVAPLAPWNAISANLFYTADNPDYASMAGKRVLPPYLIKEINGIKIGILGFTTDRGPQVVGTSVTKGFRYSNSMPGSAKFVNSDVSEVEKELQNQIDELRNVQQVDFLVMASELGLANNIVLASRNPGIDVILSSDMHEETRKPVVTGTGTVIVEEGQDGTMIGELDFTFDAKNKIKGWKWTAHTINDKIKADAKIAQMVAKVRAPFVKGTFVAQTNPFNGSKLAGPIDEVVGKTKVALHRTNFAGETMAAVVEGSGHDFVTDAFRTMGIAQFGAEMDEGARPAEVIGAIRGFRYGTHVAPGPIKREDLYHFIAIGPKIACGTIEGAKVKGQMENAADGSLNPDPRRWTGGWMFNFSGVTSDFYPVTGATYDATGATVGALNRIRNIQIQNKNNSWSAWVKESKYTYCSYYYDTDPSQINKVEISDANKPSIKVLTDANGAPMDGVEVVVQYLKTLPASTANPVLNRTTVKEPLPAYRYGFPEVQPLNKL
jgi:2',3'-cyclic-nucleotide 2'-phosphodiesterase (5'-nucleotidase family)